MKTITALELARMILDNVEKHGNHVVFDAEGVSINSMIPADYDGPGHDRVFILRFEP